VLEFVALGARMTSINWSVLTPVNWSVWIWIGALYIAWREIGYLAHFLKQSVWRVALWLGIPGLLVLVNKKWPVVQSARDAPPIPYEGTVIFAIVFGLGAALLVDRIFKSQWMTPLEVIKDKKLKINNHVYEHREMTRELEKRAGLAQKDRFNLRQYYLDVSDLSLKKELLVANYELEDLNRKLAEIKLKEAEEEVYAARAALWKAREALGTPYNQLFGAIWIVGCSYLGHWLAKTYEFDNVLGVVAGASVGLFLVYTHMWELRAQKMSTKRYAFQCLKEKEKEEGEERVKFSRTLSELPLFTLDELAIHGVIPSISNKVERASVLALLRIMLRTWPPTRQEIIGLLFCCIWFGTFGSLIYWQHADWAAYLLWATLVAAFTAAVIWSAAKWWRFRKS
jgi:hypothetical protein